MRSHEFVQENFDDGKKPGRKGLAKRVGVNCKQSVSKLRKIAANSSGERQRMAHWCANMKSGKQKTNEYVNQDMLNDNWTADKVLNTTAGPLELHARYHGAVADQIIITARLNGKDVGQVRFVVSSADRKEPVLIAGNVNVDRDKQRQGIARAMYNWARELGNTIEPSHSQTDAGRAFWTGMKDKKELDEDWRNWVTGLGAASMLAGGGSAAYDAYKNTQQTQEPQAQVKQVRAPQAKVQAPVAKSNVELAQQAQKTLSDPDAQLLTKVATAAGIKGTELAQFLAQTAHESANFTTTKEFGDKNYFKKYDIKYNPEKAKVLGNLRPGEGERYKGRGYIQLTGKYNYEQAGKALGLPLAQKPELAERPEIAAKIAVWFWKNRVKPQVDNFNNTAQATKPINPALKGLQDRRDKFAGMKVAMAKPTTLTKTAAQAPVAKVAKPAAKPVKVAAKPTKVKRG